MCIRDSYRSDLTFGGAEHTELMTVDLAAAGSEQTTQYEIGGAVEKDKALEMALSQIERQYGKGAIMRLGDDTAGVQVSSISTGSLGLDLALGVGGIPRGRVVEIFGPESSGKTTLAFHVVAEAQKTVSYTHLTLPPNRQV